MINQCVYGSLLLASGEINHSEYPNEYLSANEKYTFSEVNKKYSLNAEVISKLNKERFDKKGNTSKNSFISLLTSKRRNT